MDIDGNIKWAKTISSPGSGMSLYGTSTDYSIATDSSGNFYVVGSNLSNTLTFGDTTVHFGATSNIFVAKCDSNCHLKWITSNSKDNPMIFDKRVYLVGTDGAGNAYVAGYYAQNDTLGTIPIPYITANWGMAFVAKYESSTGNVVWARTGGNFVTSRQYVYSMAVNLKGDSYLVFPSDTGCSFAGTAFSSPGGVPNAPVTVVGLDSGGHVTCGYVLGGYSGDDLCGVGIDATGDAYVCGDFIDSCYFGDTLVHGSPVEEYFVAKLSCASSVPQLAMHSVTSPVGLNVFPNPVSGLLNIAAGNSTQMQVNNIAIYNTLGQIVLPSLITPCWRR